MKLRFVCFIIALLVLITSCATEKEAQPVTEDATEDSAVIEEAEEIPEEPTEEVVDVTGAITKEITN